MVRRAAAIGLAAIALTDHDTVSGIPTATAAGEGVGVRVIPGCEFSVRAPWGELHVLAFFVTITDPALIRFLTGAREARRQRGARMVEKLQQMGVEIDLEDLAYQAGGGAVGRPHVARALVDAGAVNGLDEAFERFLARGRPAYVEKSLPGLREVADLVHGAGGMLVAAHLGERGQEGTLRAFVADGLDGVEVRHPSHSKSVETRLHKVARRLDLAITGGSDWHGDDDLGGHAPLGGLEIPKAWLDELERRVQERGRLSSDGGTP